MFSENVGAYRFVTLAVISATSDVKKKFKIFRGEGVTGGLINQHLCQACR
jgi:hypothetical protein